MLQKVERLKVGWI